MIEERWTAAAGRDEGSGNQELRERVLNPGARVRVCGSSAAPGQKGSMLYRRQAALVAAGH